MPQPHIVSNGEHCIFPDLETPRLEGDKMEPIAVIGFAARLPGDATSAKGFWQMLSEGRSARTEIPHDRFNIDAFYHPDNERTDTTNVRTGNFVTGDIAAFDAPFFSIQPAEVASMDPQQRIMLETSYWALENSGLSVESMAGSKTCVYVGSSSRDYEALLLRDPESPAKYLGTGIGTSMLANRISWFYDLQGSSVAVDTACSGSLTALHLACQSLRSHDTTTGLVGGCSLILAPDVSMIHLSNMGFLSPDGRCRTFDDHADGYAKGEGAGFIVIKLLADALADGNTIRAVIRATGTNQDGKTPGLTQPSSTAQERNIRSTYASGGLDLGVTKYFEAHGTGTQIGDPIEVQAIGAAFKKSADDPLYVGAVKPNIGHLEAGSGVAGLIKTIMILEKGLIPPNINFERPNVALSTERWHIRFPLETVPWPIDGLRRASVNSFGYGGSNAHCVLDDAFNYLRLRGIEGVHCTAKAPPKGTLSSNGISELAANRHSPNGIPVLSTEQPKVFVWSASDEDGLRRLAYAYQAHLGKLSTSSKADDNEFMDNLSYTLSNKRSMLPWKAFVVTSSMQELVQNLPTKMSKPVRSSAAPALSFVFTGQGAQWAGMGRELLAYPAFEASLRQSEYYLQSLGSGWALIEEIQKENRTSDIDTPAVAQPSCTALQIALVDLMASWEIVATAVVGHSSGEITAAYCAGSLSHESALKVAFYRGALAARLANRTSSPRAMISVALSEEAVAPYLEEVMNLPGVGKISVGCVNSPTNVTITGDRRCVDDLNTLMDQKEIFARKLPVNVAYHSSYMEEIAAEYSSLIEDISPQSGLSLSKGHRRTPAVFSSVVGARVSPESLSQSKYWVTNLVSKVRFSDALSDMGSYLLDHRPNRKTGKDLLIEVGPTAALQRPIKDTIDKIKEAKDMEYDSILKRNVPSLESCLAFIGRLRCGGYKLNLALINSPTLKESDLQLLVDLPEYPFNHSQSYWTESRMSKNFRMRKHARHELLGAPAADWNDSEPKWRNFIRVQENPWIVDHKLGGSALYPASGMMAMAIEAARQLASPERTIRGYRLQDLVFQRALLLSSAPEGVETQLHFRRRDPASTQSSESRDFILYAYLNEEWSSICEGTVVVGYADSSPENGTGVESGYGTSSLLKDFESGVQNCKETVSSKQFYKNLANYGFHFGPTFQPLERIHYNEDREAVASICLDGWTKKMASGSTQKHVIHPTALDGLFQLGMAAISKGSWTAIPTMVPTQLKYLWISHDLLERTTTNSEIEVYTKPTFRGYREADFSTVARDANKKVRIVIEGWRETSLSSVDVSSNERGLRCYHIEWKPDLAFLDGSQVSKLCEDGIDSTSIRIDLIADRCELVCAYFMSLIVNGTFQATTELAAHLQRYIKWTQHHFEYLKLEAFLASDPDGHRMINDSMYCEKIMKICAETSPEGELCVTVGKKLPDILRGELDPLNLPFTGQLAQDLCSSPALAVTYGKISTYVDLLAHKNPSLKILEIGAGTGAATEPILRSLTIGKEHSNIPRFGEYMYTDMSSSLFEGAKERFQYYSNRMKYAVLNIEKDPLEQGFEPEKYDMIVCCLVLHATAHLNTALQNTRKLLKPGGKLVLVESSNPDCSRASFVFGLLPGWWLGTEKKRRWGPLLLDADWHDTLLENGFSGAEVCLPDSIDKRRHTFSAIISTALGTVKPKAADRKTNIIISHSSPIQNQIGLLISKKQPSCEVVTIQDIHSGTLENSFCIFLLETDSPFLASMSGQDFAALKILIASAAGILWVTQGCGERAQRPEMGLATGFGRNVGSESWGNKFVELAFEGNSSFDQTVDQIMKVYHEGLLLDWPESEYRQKDGRLCISRVVEAQDVNMRIGAKAPNQAPKQREYGLLPNQALELNIGSPGLLDSFHLKDDDRFDMPLGADEVEVKVQATGMNFKDALIALGQLPGNSLGYECAGFVNRVGKDATFSPGDRVLCCTTTGAYKTYARAHATSVTRVPHDVPFPTAAALATVFCTAYHSLFNVARLQAEESVLIHSGAGGVGQAAIQLAKLLKADIFTTVGTDEKKVYLIETYGIPEDHIFSSRNASFAGPLRQSTEGVDVVLNSLSGEGLHASWSCIRPFGRFVELGKADIQSSRGGLPMAPFAQNATFASVDLGILMDQAKPTMAATLAAVMQLYLAAKITVPQPLHIFGVSELEKAFRFMQSGKNMGKIVVEMQEDAIVPVVPSPKPTYSFDANATYVIAGGLGGLGRSITRWMADRNAKYFILLSRSGAKSKDATDLVSDMSQRGVRIAAPPCDISTEGAILNVLRDQEHKMPPVKGCIQATMVLKDGLFENMSRENFDDTIKPKVQGSWNLHKHLPQHLDFFVLLSSVAGVTGSRGQSNYAAGNTYQDALARHRVSLGEKCISLDLGPILSIGFAAEVDMTEALEADGFVGIRKSELFALLDYCCDPSLPLCTAQNCQIVTGISGIESLKADKLERAYWAKKPLFSILKQKRDVETSTSGNAGGTVDYAHLLTSAESQAAAEDIVVEALKSKLSNSLSVPKEDIDAEKAIYSFGIDSLVALEVRYWFMKEMKANIPIFDIMQNQSLLALGQFAAGKSEYR